MKKEEFLQMVKDELDTIKTTATKNEIQRLDFKIFDEASSELCIYGQMTSHCSSARAFELMPKKFEFFAGESFSFVPFSKISFREGTKFTALEKYLVMVDKKMHKQIIQYLKGEINVINLK